MRNGRPSEGEDHLNTRECRCRIQSTRGEEAGCELKERKARKGPDWKEALRFPNKTQLLSESGEENDREEDREGE